MIDFSFRMNQPKISIFVSRFPEPDHPARCILNTYLLRIGQQLFRSFNTLLTLLRSMKMELRVQLTRLTNTWGLLRSCACWRNTDFLRMFHALGDRLLKYEPIGPPPRREEALALIVEAIVRSGISLTYEEIGRGMNPPVTKTRARQYVDQLVAVGVLTRVIGSQRGIRIRDASGCRALIEAALGNSGWWHSAPLGKLQAPCTSEQLPIMPEFEHLPDID